MAYDENDDFNPFASPQTFDDLRRKVNEFGVPITEPEPIRPCPQCGGANAEPAPYDWWRGRRAPVAVQHVVCPDCQCEYNGETAIAYRPAKSPWIMFIIAATLVIAYFTLICGGALLG